MLVGLTLGESIAASTVLYFLCVAAFNAGYYSKIPARFVELFSFTDMLGANVPIFQYFLTLVAIYGTIMLPFAWAVSKYGPHIRASIDRHFLMTHSSWVLFYAGLAFLLGISLLLIAVAADLHIQSFTLRITPHAIFQGGFFIFIG
jgi:hypothetical protein